MRTWTYETDHRIDNPLDCRQTDAAHTRIDDQVHVALAIAHFLVGQPVPLVREWSQCLRQEFETLDL
ncbi:MAG: hypothetical protein ACE5EQ_04385, partial [Phycisphaerae bacterium]